MERVKITPESYARKIEFIETAMGEGAHLRIPRSKATGMPLSEKAWNKIVDIGLLYHVGPDTTGPSIGEIYKVSKEAIRLTRNRFLVDLHHNSSKVTQKKFPLNSLVLGKPIMDSTREKMSEVSGGIGLKLKRLVEEEYTDSDVILSKLGITRAHLKIIMNTQLFRGSGLNLEVKGAHIFFKEVEEKVNQLTDDGELQKYLDSLSGGSIRGFLHRRNKTQDVFGLIGATLKELGFRDNSYAKPVALKLKADGIPLKLVPGGINKKAGREYQETYLVYFLKHKERVIKAIEALGPLNKNPEILNLKKA